MNIVGAFLFHGFAAFGLMLAPVADAQEVRTHPLPTVTVSKAIVSTVIARVPVAGTLVPREEVLVSPQVSGYNIQAINADVGDKVAKGDVLVVLNDSTLRAQLAQEQAELTQANATVHQAADEILSAKATATQTLSALKRAEKLRASGNIAQATLDKNIATEASARAAVLSAEDGLAVAKAKLTSAQSQRDLAALNLSKSNIVAPVSGVISARNAKIGAIASTSADAMFRMIRDGVIEMEAEVIETSLGSVSHGDRVELSIAGVGKSVGSVRLIPPSVDAVTRLAVVKVQLAEHPNLRTGLYAGGWIITDEREALTVPSAAVHSDIDGAFVQVVESGVIVTKKITAGLIWKNRQEIVSGLQQGETVVAKAGAFFTDGDHIKPIPEKSAVEVGQSQ